MLALRYLLNCRAALRLDDRGECCGPEVVALGGGVQIVDSPHAKAVATAMIVPQRILMFMALLPAKSNQEEMV